MNKKNEIKIICLFMAPLISFANEIEGDNVSSKLIVSQWYNDVLNIIDKSVNSSHRKYERQADQQQSNPFEEDHNSPLPQKQQRFRYDYNQLSRDDILKIQALLNEKGYSVGVPDGIPGVKTSRAIKKYQQQSGLPVDGKPSLELLKHLSTYVVKNNSVSGKNNARKLNSKWLGTWKAQFSGVYSGKEKTILISPTKLKTTRLVSEHDSSLTEFDYHWVDRNIYRLGKSEFGFSDKKLSIDHVKNSYEAAIKTYQQDPDDFTVSDTVLTRKALSNFSFGSYRTLWAYDGGSDCGYFEYIVDGDKMLERMNCRYGQEIILYNRVNPTSIKSDSDIIVFGVKLGKEFEDSMVKKIVKRGRLSGGRESLLIEPYHPNPLFNHYELGFDGSIYGGENHVSRIKVWSEELKQRCTETMPKIINSLQKKYGDGRVSNLTNRISLTIKKDDLVKNSKFKKDFKIDAICNESRNNTSIYRIEYSINLSKRANTIQFSDVGL